MAGFLVPFLSGGLIKAQQIRDEYDDNAGTIIDTVAPKYNKDLDINQKSIALHKANYDAVASALGIPAAEIASNTGYLKDVRTAEVVNHVQTSLKDVLQWIGDKDIETLKTEYPDAFQSLFSERYQDAISNLSERRDWAAKNFNKAATKSVADTFLGKKDEQPSAIGKVKKLFFGEPITEGTGAAYEQAVAEKLGTPVRIESDDATFSLMKEFYADQGKTFKTQAEMNFYAWSKIMKWNARTGENFFALSDQRKNEVGNEILPTVGNLQLYSVVENEYLSDPAMEKLTADLYTNNPVWMAVQNALVLASQKGYASGDQRSAQLPEDIIKNLKNTPVGDLITDYNSLLNISNAFDTRFKLVLDQAKDLPKDITGGDPQKVAERVGLFYTKIGFSDDLKVNEINPDNNSGIIGTFITAQTAQNPKGVKMYIYRGVNGQYWAIPQDPDRRLSSNPLPLLEAQVNELINK